MRAKSGIGEGEQDAAALTLLKALLQALLPLSVILPLALLKVLLQALLPLPVLLPLVLLQVLLQAR